MNQLAELSAIETVPPQPEIAHAFCLCQDQPGHEVNTQCGRRYFMLGLPVKTDQQKCPDCVEMCHRPWICPDCGLRWGA
jgi:hypothetical protein